MYDLQGAAFVCGRADRPAPMHVPVIPKEGTMEKYIDTLIKIFPILVAVAGGLWTLNTYFDNQRQASQLEQAARVREERSQLLQAQQPFLEHRWKAYIETSSVAGALVVLDTADPSWVNARRRFWELYWSELAMVETPDVATAMVNFAGKLTAVDAALGKDQTVLGDARRQLNTSALVLARTLKESIQSSWGFSAASSQ
jgi:hypothetical protein